MAVTMSVHRRASPGGGLSSAKKRIWGDDLVRLMIGRPSPTSSEDQGTMTTLDLLGCGDGSSSSASASSSCSSGPDLAGLELDMELPPPPSGWEKRLDLKAGKFYYVHLNTGRSTYDHPGFANDALLQRTVLEPLRRPGEDLDLKLGSSASSSKPVRMPGRRSSKHMPGLGILTSTTRTSCSSDSNRSEANGVVLTSCKACLMYVMLSRLDPRCPKCGCHVAVESHLQAKKQRIR